MILQLLPLGLMFIIIVLTIYVVAKMSGSKNVQDKTVQELRKQIDEMYIKQLEMQNKMLKDQQDFVNGIQKNVTDQLMKYANSMSESLSQTRTNINSTLSSSLNNTNTVINDLHKKIGVIEQTAKNLHDISKDIASLQDILKAPKLRGNLGELFLEELLKQIFPQKNYTMQYQFKNGTKVDAVINLSGNIVPIDSKFPLESFQRYVTLEGEAEKSASRKEFIKSVKLRIDEIAQRYINPSEGTYDFALMYIPAENVFYEIILNDTMTGKEYELFNYAIERHVIPVSPNSFYAYLMAIAYGLKGFKIEQNAKQIQGELSKLHQSFGLFYKDFESVGKAINTASSKYNDCTKKVDKFQNKIGEITGIKIELLEDNSLIEKEL